MLAVLAVLVSPLGAFADTPAGIDVVVTRAPGFNATTVQVSAFRFENGFWQTQDSTATTIEGGVESARLYLAGGEYRVCAQDPANVYVMTCIGGGTSPDDPRNTTVTVGADFGSVPLSLQAPTSIGGTVTDDQGTPLKNAAVRVVRIGSEAEVVVHTDDLGTYEVPVNPGSYQVGFDAAHHVSEFYDDAATTDAATPVEPAEGAPAEGVDAELLRLATISGSVDVDGLTEEEAAGLAVVAYDDDGDPVEVARDEELREGATGLDYTLADLGAGSYQVCVLESSAVVATCLETPVAVAPPERRTGVDIVPTLKGRAVGQVTGASAEPLTGVKVTAYDHDVDGWHPAGSVTTDGSGDYALRLTAGDYRIGFSGGGHQREYYDDSATLAGAATITVANEGDTRADAELAPGGTISGAFAGPSGSDLDGVRVVAYVADEPGQWREEAADDSVSGGSYAVEGLPAGTYRICAVVDGIPWRPGCVGALTVDGAGDIVLTGPVVTSGHDLTLQPAASSVVLTDLSVQGSPVVGETLTVSATRWPSNAAVTWTWKRGSTPVGTGAEYEVQPGDVGEILHVEGLATATSMLSWQGIAGQAGPVIKAVFTATPVPTISGATGPSATPQVGDTLQAITGTWSPAPAAFAYEWLVGGEIAGSGASYQVSPGDEGEPVALRVHGTRPGFVDPAWQESPATAAVLSAPVLQAVTQPGIAGAAIVGGRLTATAPTWNPAGVAMSYQWRLGGTVIGTGTEITVPVAAQGAQLQLVVTGARTGSAPVTLAPVSSAVVAAGRIGVQATGRISGKAKVRKKLTYVAERTTPAASTRAFQWLRNGKPIKKATKASYKLAKADKGKRISLRVTLGAPGHQPLVLTTARTAKVRK